LGYDLRNDFSKGGFGYEIYNSKCSAMTLDTYGDANADALTLASEKLKDTFNDNSEWFGLEEEQEDTAEE
jgi:hypothetical protein